MTNIDTELTTEPVNEIGDADITRQPTRRLARETALRAAYVLDIRKCSIDEALRDPLVNNNEKTPSYTLRLLTFSDTYRDYIDDLIRSKVERWEFHRIALIDRLVIRLSLVELLYFTDVPPKVTINEAIEVAKKYSTSKSGRFVNGILDSVYSDLTNGTIQINTQT